MSTYLVGSGTGLTATTLEDPVALSIAQSHNRTAAQVIINWLWQQVGLFSFFFSFFLAVAVTLCARAFSLMFLVVCHKLTAPPPPFSLRTCKFHGLGDAPPRERSRLL